MRQCATSPTTRKIWLRPSPISSRLFRFLSMKFFRRANRPIHGGIKFFGSQILAGTEFFACCCFAFQVLRNFWLRPRKVTKILAYLASLLLEDTSGYQVDGRLHISFFSGKIWPTSLRNFFALDCHKSEKAKEFFYKTAELENDDFEKYE